MDDCYDLPALEMALAGSRFAGRLQFFGSIASTNVHAMAEAEAGAPDGSVYFADEQTGGRGRGARTWSSPAGTGIYVSVLLRPRMAPADVLWLSLAAGLAAQEAIRSVTSLEADLRWPNDLLFGKKKFCGILTELNAEVTRVRHAVIGMGINVHQDYFPEEIRGVATSLYLETGRSWPRQDLIIALLKALEREIAALSGYDLPAATRSICERLEAGSSWIRGKQVRVEEGEGMRGITEGLDARGFLQVRTSEGLRTVFSGGVREL